jgi:hypothetical protein
MRSARAPNAPHFTRLLTRQCLHMLHDLCDELEVIGRSASVDGRPTDYRLHDMGLRIRLVSEEVRAVLERDRSVSVAQVVRLLRTFKHHLLPPEPTYRCRHW